MNIVKFFIVFTVSFMMLSKRSSAIDKFFTKSYTAVVQTTNPDEIEVGKWTLLPGSILIIKKTNNTYWLMQTDKNRSYYVVRGMNFLYDSNVQVMKPINRGKLSNEITGDGGLQSSKDGSLPNNWDTNWWSSNGFNRNEIGEFVKNNVVQIESDSTKGVLVVITPPTQQPDNKDPKVIGSPTQESSLEKIKVPVGAIMWDSWYRDYWNDENPKYDLLINHVSKQRLIATEYMDNFKVVPFYGQYHEPENIKIRYNVRWSQELGRNIFDEVERPVQVKFDKNQDDTDKEIQYYSEAGFDFLCFNYYKNDSPLSEARLQFVNSTNKRGLKMTFILAPNRSDSEIDYITDLMLKDYWFKIDGKPVLYFDIRDIPDLPKYKSSYAEKGGGDLYLVYYNGGGYPDNLERFQNTAANAASSYTMFMGQGTADELIEAEVVARESWLKQFQYTGLSLIPTLTTGFENLYNRSSLDLEPVKFIEKASLPQIEQKLELMKEFIKKNPSKVPAILWYAANEILESGNPIVPTKRRDGTIDTSMLDTIKKHLE